MIHRFSLVFIGTLSLFEGSVAFAQLDAELSVQVSRNDEDGSFRYDYVLSNSILSAQSINSILLSTGLNAPISQISVPNGNWTSSYAMEEELFQAGFATGLSEDQEECGATNEFDVFPGQSVEFFVRSPWAPAEQDYALGRTEGRGVDCDFVGDFATGRILSPSTAIQECDFDADTQCGLNDLDRLTAAIAQNSVSSIFDLNLDTILDSSDLDLFLEIVGRDKGDADLNGVVAFADFLTISRNFSKPGTWSQGDFDADGKVAFADFLILSGNFGAKAARFYAVPESKLDCTVVVALLATPLTGRRKRSIHSIIDPLGRSI